MVIPELLLHWTKIICWFIHSTRGNWESWSLLTQKSKILRRNLILRKWWEFYSDSVKSMCQMINFQTFSPKHDLMYVADTITGNLYSLNLTPIRFLNFSIIESKKLSIRSPLTFIGSLLGPPKDLRLNSKGSLFYIIPKFSTVVS